MLGEQLLKSMQTVQNFRRLETMMMSKRKRVRDWEMSRTRSCTEVPVRRGVFVYRFGMARAGANVKMRTGATNLCTARVSR